MLWDPAAMPASWPIRRGGAAYDRDRCAHQRDVHFYARRHLGPRSRASCRRIHPGTKKSGAAAASRSVRGTNSLHRKRRRRRRGAPGPSGRRRRARRAAPAPQHERSCGGQPFAARVLACQRAGAPAHCAQLFDSRWAARHGSIDGARPRCGASSHRHQGPPAAGARRIQASCGAWRAIRRGMRQHLTEVRARAHRARAVAVQGRRTGSRSRFGILGKRPWIP